MTGVSFAGVARQGQHAVARWVIAHWDRPPEEVQIVRRWKDLTKGHKDRGGMGAFGALFENWTAHEVLEREKDHDRLIVCPVRDLLNWFASWWYCPNEWPGEISHEKRVDVWRANAQALLDQTPGIIFIKYNEWFSSEEYRRSISKQLGQPFTDKALRLSGTLGVHEGGHSSFEKKKDGQDLDVLNRWKQLGTYDRARARVKPLDPFKYILEEDLALNKEIFGDIYK
jgi:hypothetical protein